MADPEADLRARMLHDIGSAPDGPLVPGKFHRWGKRSNPPFYVKVFPDWLGAVFGDFSQEVHLTWALSREGMTKAELAASRAAAAVAWAEQQAARRAEWRRNKDRFMYWLRRSKDGRDGPPVVQYLRHRLRLTSFEPPACIRFVADMPYRHGEETIGCYPAMVAPLVDRTGEVFALHRTYLSHDGRKAEVPGPVKKLTPAAGPLGGTCIPLGEPVGDVLGIAEGIETALGASLLSGLPTVAAYSAGNLAAWKWPAVRRVVVFGDADDAGRTAAEALRVRVLAAGLKCQVLTPETDGMDWCDVHATRAETEGAQ